MSSLSAPAPTVGNHVVTLNTGNGYGSTNNKIRRFSVIETNTGSAISYDDSSSLGATFTINDDGFYNIYYCDAGAAGGALWGVSLNSSQLTTAVQGITAADRKAFGNASAANEGFGVSVTLKLSAGDVIRAQTGGVLNTASAYQTAFSIRKVG